MKVLNRTNFQQFSYEATPYQERVIQFGEGNFLRGFVDWMVHRANKADIFNGSVVVVQPIEHGLVAKLNEQDGLFTMISRGLVNGEEVVEEEVITSISRGLLAVGEWDKVLECAADPNIDILVSNTTEAGITYSASDRLEQTPPASFPGKVTAYLYHRFKTFDGAADKGMLLLPCELIDRNGDNLKAIVLRLAKEWELGDDFINWVETANIFANTLVDRIVTGYPGKEEASKLGDKYGYQDELVNTAEIFHLWVIEAPAGTEARFPIHEAGLEVKWVEDMTAYRTRKVRILNGGHTSTVALAYLSGFDYVKPAVNDDAIGEYLNSVIFDEIIPTCDMDAAELKVFADQVIERFKNPYIQHRWLDISLNSISKYNARVLPSLLPYLEKGEEPALLSFSLATLISLYRGIKLTDEGLVCKRDDNEYLIRDDRSILEFFHALWQSADDNYTAVAEQVLSQVEFWGEDLTKYGNFVTKIAEHLKTIDSEGMEQALANVMSRRKEHAKLY